MWKQIDSKKIPYYANGKPRKEPDSENDKSQLATYQEAQDKINGEYAGIGLAISPPLIGIDLDKCINEQGQITNQAESLIKLFDSYTEKSPSGNGFHILCEGVAPGGHSKKPTHCDYEYELYSDKRFFTFTGNHLKGTPKGINHVQKQTLEKQTARLPRKQEGRTQSPVTKPKASKENTHRALKALETACYAVENAEQGGGGFGVTESRSDAINKYGYLVGQFAGAGLLNKEEAIEKILEAAQQNPYPLSDQEI